MPSASDFWTEFSKQAPGIVGVLAIAFMFLKWGVQPFLAYLREQTISWQAFLKEQRELSNSALAKMSDEIKALTNAVGEVKTMIQTHDSWERESAAGQREILESIKRQRRKTGPDV